MQVINSEMWLYTENNVLQGYMDKGSSSKNSKNKEEDKAGNNM